MAMPSRVPANLLYQIEQELDEDEKEMLGFMCRDVAPDASAQDPRGILDTLNEKGLLSPHGLSELVYRARRFDLLKRLLKTGKAAVEAHLKKQQLVCDYRVLMLDLNEELDTNEVASLAFLLRDNVGHGRLVKAKTFLAMAVELEKMNLLAPHKMDVLEKCFQNIQRVDLKKRIQKYKQAGPTSARCFQQAYTNVWQASLPNLSLADPLHAPEIRSSERPRTANGNTTCPAAEQVHISVQESGASVWQGPDDRYKMQSRPLGICLLVDCIGNDAAMLKETFMALHFEVLCYMYVTLEDLVRTVSEVARMPKHRDCDIFVCVLISRGSPQSVFGIDQNFPGFALDEMKNVFTGDSCPGLLGKPKLFFIQNYVVHGSPEETSSLLEVDGNEHRFNGGRWQSSGIPREADIFWSHCKVDSLVLQESSSSSSSYLLCLSQLLRDEKRRLHLLDIHTELNRRVYEMNTNLDPRNHYSLLLQHTLRKKLFLTRS